MKLLDNKFWFGIESGYPLCCVIFFCDVWCPIRAEHRMFHGKSECYDCRNNKVQYVQCPDCIVESVTKTSDGSWFLKILTL